MKVQLFRGTMMLLVAAFFIAVTNLQAAPSLPITEPPVSSSSLDGPPTDPGSTNGQWFLSLGGTEEYRTREFHDNMSGFGGGNMENLAIQGKVTWVNTNAAGQITAFDIDAYIHNDTPSTDGQESSSTNSHSESRPAGTGQYIGKLVDTKLTAEFAVIDQSTLPSAFGHPATPYRGTDPLIIAENEDQYGWYCWNNQDPPNGQEAGKYYVPTWDFGDIPTNQSGTRLLQFSVTPAMDSSDPRYGVIMNSLENDDDVFANRTPSLKISTWIDDIGTDFPGPEGMLRKSDVSVFHNIEEEPPPPGYPHKMHWPQLPDPNGWDVRACNWDAQYGGDGQTKILADDFMCTSNGPITKITFWGSFRNDSYEVEVPFLGITNVHLSIHNDIPDPDGIDGPEFSKPALPASWAWDIDPYNLPAGWTLTTTQVVVDSAEGWYDPNNPDNTDFPNHYEFFQYEVTIPPADAFVQVESNIYWLDISVLTEWPEWGWKTSASEHFMDDAVWADVPVQNTNQWGELIDPYSGESLDLAFVIDGGEEEPEDPHKMHWPQYPDPNGWDVRASYGTDGLQKVLADDFLCTSNGPITHITFWGSWFFDEFEQLDLYQGITNIHLSIHRDIPDPDPQDPANYSMPALPPEKFWNIDPHALPPNWTVTVTPEDPSLQGWYDPNLPSGENFMTNNHSQYFRYDVWLPPEEAFVQVESNIYWLDISLESVSGQWGWKTSRSQHYNDDAVWADMPVLDLAQWGELRDPLEPEISLDLAFIIDDGVPQAFDFGDAPDGAQGTAAGDYETRKADNGAYHIIVAGAPYFDDGSGSDQPDPEPDGQPDPTAMGDDNDILYFPPVNDDENGIAFPAPLLAGQNSSVNITVDDGAGGLGAGGGYVDAWIDFNANGAWTDAGEQIWSGWLAQGTNSVSFLVPAGSTIGQTFGRFRITSVSTGLPPTGGPAQDGEVEDHEVYIQEQEIDWGDADDPTFPTLKASSGANHLIVPGILLGTFIDSEADGQPHPNALGDDNAGIPDDEDGVIFNPLNPIPGQPGQVSVTVAGSGYLNAWFDWANDGNWAQPGDHVYVDIPLSTGTTMLNFNAPTNMPWGTQLVSRFRFSSVSNLTYTGSAPDGEVEDHAFKTEAPPDHELGDAPDSSNSFATNMTAYPIGGPAGIVAHYPTVYGSGSPAPVGPIHWLPLNQAYLGPAVSREEEADTSPDEDVVNNIIPLLDQPDNDGNDDALAGLGPLSLPHGRQTTLNYNATWSAPVATQMFVNVWFDWNRDGDWSDTLVCPDGASAPEWAVQNDPLPTSPGPFPVLINVTTPSFRVWNPGSSPKPIWMRMTLAEQTWPLKANAAGGEGPTNGYLYGETEDYYVTNYEVVDEYDFGDAPDSPYPTLLPGGARHYMISNFNLGTLIDYEADGQTNVTATGDDLAGVDDEDGVTMGALIRGSSTAVNVFLTSGAAGGKLDAWVDFNGNGTWGAGEKIFNAVVLSPGATNISFSVPISAALGPNYARFRLSSAGNLLPGGTAPDGEVEDYQVTILQPTPSPDILITNFYVINSNTLATVEWNAQSNITYQAQSTTNLMISNSWMNVGGYVLGPINWQTNSAAPTNQFYRIIAPWTP